MTTQASLLHAICENPADDDVRLVYADWLDDHGQSPRAEFIRVQVALARLDAWDPRGYGLRKRECALHVEYGDTWKAELPTLPEGAEWDNVFHRGFIDTIRVWDKPRLLEHEEAILDAVPLRRISLLNWESGDSLAGTQTMRKVRELEFVSTQRVTNSLYDTRLLANVFTWPELQRISYLGLHSLGLGQSGGNELSRAELPALTSLSWTPWDSLRANLPGTYRGAWWSQLVDLELKATGFREDGFARLCTRLNPQRLRRLAIRDGKLRNDDAEVLADSGLLANLDLLDVSNNSIEAEGIQRILSALPESARFVCTGNPVGTEGLTSLVRSPFMARVTEIRGGGRDIRAPGILAVASSEYVRNVANLELGMQGVTTSVIEALLTSPKLASLRRLDLTGNRIGSLPPCRIETLEKLFLSDNPLAPSGILEFLRVSYLPALERLELRSVNLNSVTVKALSLAKGFPSLTSLNLSKNPLETAGAIAIMTGTGLPSLSSLDLTYCRISDDVLRAWWDSPRLGQLTELKLQRGNTIDPTMYREFCEHALRRGCNVDNYASSR